jgi:hypothetical protein
VPGRAGGFGYGVSLAFAYLCVPAKLRKRFFFEKKEAKNFRSCGRWRRSRQGPQFSESFLLLFFKKEALT